MNKSEKEKAVEWVMNEMFNVIPNDKRMAFENAINRHSILTSGYYLPHGKLEVFIEGWYVTFEGCRSKFSYWCFDNDGEFVPGRKPTDNKLHKLWGFAWYNEEARCEMCCR